MDKRIKTLRSYLTLLFQFAAWAYNIVTQFLSPPPTSALACLPNTANCVSSTEHLAKYGLAILIGLAIIATRSFGKRRHLSLWIVLTIITLVSAYGSYTYYYHLHKEWICELDNPPSLRIKGEQLTDVARDMASEPGCVSDPPCKGLLECFEKDPKKVWVDEEIDRRRVYLTATYFSVMPLFVLGLIFISQAIYCATEEDSSKQFIGHWKSASGSEPSIKLEIIIANRKINGKLLNQLDPPHIADAKIKGDTLTFVHGRNRTKYEMNLVNENEASLVQVNDDKPTTWTLFKN